MEEKIIDLKTPKKTFSTVGFALCVYIAVGILVQLAFLSVPALIWGKDNWYYNTTWGQWISSFVPMYLFALPVFALIMRALPAKRPAENRINVGKMFAYFLISYCIIYAGNIIGTVLSLVFSAGKAQNPISDLAMDINPLKVVVMVILAPLFEELIFRKIILDRIGKYGEKTAVIVSAFAFGLLHQNLFQFFYAFGVGLIFGYIYMRTGKIRYSVILHTIINFMGAVIAPWLLTLFDIEKLLNLTQTGANEEIMAYIFEILPGLLIYFVYTFILYGIVIAGFVLLIIKLTKFKWNKTEEELPKGTAFKTAYINPGMICYILVCTVFIILALFTT
ncbi:MAG: CPBP family intramembrane metalloprotease [Clostridia bacterium]|nr:CPBP family intramembrane metalloprotease [Clostridia bacterium]